MDFLLQLVMNGLVVGSIYALVALGFVIIYKSSSILNFAQGEFLMMGAYFCVALVAAHRVPLWAAFLVTLAFFGAMGVTQELPLSWLAQKVRTMRVYEGPTEVHRMVIARRLLGGR